MMAATGIARGLTGAEVEHFQQYGFARLKQVVPEDEIARLRDAADAALRAIKTSPTRCDLTEFARSGNVEQACGPGGCAMSFERAQSHDGRGLVVEELPAAGTMGHFLADCSLWRRSPALRALEMQGELPRMAAELLGARAVRLYDDRLMIKEPGTRERTAFHQDLSYFHVDGDRACVFSLFLDRARRGVGELGFVPSSHRWGQLFKPNFLISEVACPGSEGVDLPAIDAAPEAFGVQYVDVEPGDVLVHHALTLCGMRGNRGATPCRLFQFCYVDAGLHFRRRPGLAVSTLYDKPPLDGAPLDNAVHPVVWPPVKSTASAA
jgi:hypothetical protein